MRELLILVLIVGVGVLVYSRREETVVIESVRDEIESIKQAEELARKKEAELERQKEAEAKRQKEAEAKRQKEAEAERQKEAEAERQKEAEAERQKEAAQKREAIMQEKITRENVESFRYINLYNKLVTKELKGKKLSISEKEFMKKIENYRREATLEKDHLNMAQLESFIEKKETLPTIKPARKTPLLDRYSLLNIKEKNHEQLENSDFLFLLRVDKYLTEYSNKGLPRSDRNRLEKYIKDSEIIFHKNNPDN